MTIVEPVQRVLSFKTNSVVTRMSYEEFKREYIPTIAWSEGYFITLYGKPGVGKTNFAMRLAQDVWSSNKRRIFLTNFLVKEERFKYMSTASRLLELLCEYKYPLIIFDDITSFYNSKDSMAKRVKDLDSLMSLIRKFKANVIFIGHVEQYIPRMAKEFTQQGGLFIFKKERTKAIVRTGEGMVIVEDIPATTMNYDTYDWGTFTFDIPLQELLDYINKKREENAEIDLKATVLEFIDEWRKKQEETENKDDYRYWLAKTAMMLKESGRIKTFKEFTDLLGIKYETLRTWIRRFYNEG